MSWLLIWVSHGECTGVYDAHWTWAIVNHDIRLSIFMIHHDTILHELLSLRGYWTYDEINKGFWPMSETLKWSHILGLSHYWWKLVAISILNRGTITSHGIKIMCTLRWSKGHAIMKFVALIMSLMEFNICFLDLEYASWSYNKWDL